MINFTATGHNKLYPVIIHRAVGTAELVDKPIRRYN